MLLPSWAIISLRENGLLLAHVSSPGDVHLGCSHLGPILEFQRALVIDRILCPVDGSARRGTARSGLAILGGGATTGVEPSIYCGYAVRLSGCGGGRGWGPRPLRRLPPVSDCSFFLPRTVCLYLYLASTPSV